MWAKSFTTLSQWYWGEQPHTAMQVDMMGNLFVTGTFQGETDFGG